MQELYFFKRIEKKYLITPAMRDELLAVLGDKLQPDAHGRSTIMSLYLDTPDFRLIRQSLDARTYKEKLRIRSYGVPGAETPVFFEIKKKYKGVVYKRRLTLPLTAVMDYLQNAAPPCDTQVMREIDYAMHLYRHPQPAMLVAYERDAYFADNVPDLRITFDTGVRYRATELSLSAGDAGAVVPPPDKVIMEIKTNGAMPLWLAKALDDLHIYPSRFSKYGTAYRDYLIQKGDLPHV